MDDKFGWTAALLIGMLLVGGSLGFLGGMAANDAPADDEVEVDATPPTDTNEAPLLSVNDAVHEYGVMAFTVSGLVADEDATTVVINVEMVNPIDESDRQGPFSFYAGSDGKWSGVLPITMPGEWVLVVTATDAEGASSGSEYASAVMPTPIEPAAELTMTFVEPDSGSAWANILGEVEHPYSSTCTVVYQPQGQEILNGEVLQGLFSIPLDYNATNHAGEIIADCGLFTMTHTVVAYAIPELYTEEPDADRDGIADDDDACDNTPEGEPVHPDGCSDSELDGDQDGVSDAEDECEGHDDSIDVDQDGIPDGCDPLVDSDGDGVSDADDICEGADDSLDFDNDGTPDGCDFDIDGDGVANGPDQCPNTPDGTVVDADGCPAVTWEPQDSWRCTEAQGPWVKDYNEDYYGSNRANNNGVSSAGGSGSGPWFQCVVAVNVQNDEMTVSSNGIPNHDFLSTLGCCADEMDYTAHITLSPVDDTAGGHSSTDCPAAAGRWECAPDRGPVAIGVNGVPIYGPEEGPGGDAVALHFDYFDEDRQPIELGWCAGHSAGPNGYHYHYDANCIYWEPEMGEDMSDYDLSKIQSDQHSPIVGWAFDGYPIYGMYGYDEDGSSIRSITSSYVIERTQDGGDQGYNGISDWNYVDGIGDLDECNGRFGPTPEYPDGIYHYVSTPLSGSPTPVTDTNGDTVGMIGFPYFLLCYHGIADVSGQDMGSGQGGPPPQGQGTSAPYGFLPENIDWKPPEADGIVAPSMMELAHGLLLLTTFLLVGLYHQQSPSRGLVAPQL